MRRPGRPIDQTMSPSEPRMLFSRSLFWSQGLFGFLVVAPVGGFVEFARNGRHQPGQVVLEQVVLRAGAHGADGDVLANVAGDDDEGQIGVVPPGDFQRLQAAESGMV